MNHLINRRLSKRQQMRYAMKGASLSTTDPQKLRPASPHWMRHTHATHALAHGAELTIVRDNLRHASISTASIYHRAMTRGGRSRSPGRLGTDECRERRWPAIRSTGRTVAYPSDLIRPKAHVLAVQEIFREKCKRE
jgi:hypothetical protein